MARVSPKSEHDRGFNITVEQTIGRVGLSPGGEYSQIEVAFLMIAEHHQRSEMIDATYRLPGPDEGQVIEIAVTCHDDRATEVYFN